MITTTVPAQITTVEDKIVGEITLIRLFLIVAPVFGGAILYIGLPPFVASAPYKVVFMVLIAAVSWTLAVRIKGRTLLSWSMVLAKYRMRPRYYLYNKNAVNFRDIPKPQAQVKSVEESEQEKPQTTTAQPLLSTADRVYAERLISNPDANLNFRTDKKGVLRAYITEVK